MKKHIKIDHKTLLYSLLIASLLAIFGIGAVTLHWRSETLERGVTDLFGILSAHSSDELKTLFVLTEDEYEDIDQIDIAVNCGNLSLVPADDDDITLLGGGIVESRLLSCDRVGSTLSVKGSVRLLNAEVCIRLPEELLEDRRIVINITGASPLILVRGFGSLLSRSELIIDARGGDIALSGLNAQRLAVSSTNGDVLVDECCSVVLSVSSTEGAIDVDGAFDEVLLSSEQGSIAGNFEALFNRADLRSDSGDIGVIVPEESGLLLNLIAYRGKLSLPVDAVAEISPERSALTYTINDGVIPLNVSNSSGSFTLHGSLAPNAVKERLIEMLLRIYGTEESVDEDD